jgi:hypothetical protein
MVRNMYLIRIASLTGNKGPYQVRKLRSLNIGNNGCFISGILCGINTVAGDAEATLQVDRLYLEQRGMYLYMFVAIDINLWAA